MKFENGTENRGTFEFSFRSLVLFLLFSAFAHAAITAESSEIAGCNFALSISDWRAISFLGLMLSTVLIGFMYMYGSAIDSSFIARAKNEFYQVIFTALILVSFTAIVSFMCGDTLSDLFGKEGSSFAAAESYLTKLSSYLSNTAIAIGVMGSALGSLSSVSVKKYYVASKSFEVLSNPISYMSDSSFALYFIAITAYVLTTAQLHVIKIIPYVSLFFLVPIGIVLRSIIPFRRFGGALLGTGIGLYVLIPFVLLLNGAMVDKYVASDRVFETLSCTSDFDCYSHICEFDSERNLQLCSSLKTIGQACETDDQCQSGYCEQTVSGKNCSSCGGDGIVAARCCEGFIKNPATGKCEIAKSNGETCTNNNECISGLCSEISGIYSTIHVGSIDDPTAFSDDEITNEASGQKMCVPKKSIGESCTDWRECASRACTGIYPNEACSSTIKTEDDTNYLIAAAYMVSGASPSTQFQVLDSFPTTFTGSSSQNIVGISTDSESTITKYIKKLFDLAVMSFIAGILLPLLNLTIISKGVKDLSGALGSEMDIASIWKII